MLVGFACVAVFLGLGFLVIARLQARALAGLGERWSARYCSLNVIFSENRFPRSTIARYSLRNTTLANQPVSSAIKDVTTP